MTMDEINAMDEAAFVAALGGVFEHSPWVAKRACAARPFANVAALHAAMVAVVDRATEAEKLALLRAHPELAGKAAVRGELTADSTNEQSGAGLSNCSSAEFALLNELNDRYNRKFGFPFILAVKGHDRAGIIGEFSRRVDEDRASEFNECLAQIARITRFRLDALVTTGQARHHSGD